MGSESRMNTSNTGWRARIEHEVQFGWAMRAQRLTEAAVLLLAFGLREPALVYVVFASLLLQVLSPRLVPFGWLVAFVKPTRASPALADLYFDLGGIRGASAISCVVFAFGLWLHAQGWEAAAWALWAAPAASLLLAPTVGFCAGCWFYVIGRELLRRGLGFEGNDERVDIRYESVERDQ